jgi:hypothetical protein
MTLRPQPFPPVTEAAGVVVQAAFPTGPLDVALRAEFGTLSAEQRCADRSPPAGRPVAGAPWRLARVMLLPSSAGLTARQAAAAGRRCLEWP